MPNWYCGREAVKNTATIAGSDQDAKVDRIIEAMSRKFDKDCGRRPGNFLPHTETRLFPWPPYMSGTGWRLWIETYDLLSVTALLTKAQDSSPTTIASADYFLEPNVGAPYNRIEIDLSSSSAFEGGETSQRSISVAGSWGRSNDTEAAGALAEDLTASETAVDVTDASLIEVGDTLLVDSEQMFVSERALLDTTANMTTSLTAAKSGTTVAVNDGTLVKQGEVISIESERMYVESISGNNLTVIRAYDGSTLAAHTQPIDVYAYRTMTCTRGQNGTTAATHSSAAAISRYRPPLDVMEAVLASSVVQFTQGQAAFGRVVGTGDAQREYTGKAMRDLWSCAVSNHKRWRNGAI